jgi:glycosyltransferase involved in cell wall biosynthesis
VRILMVVRPAAGGMREHLLALSGGLTRAGHEVEVAAPAGSDVAGGASAAGCTVHEIPLVGPLHPLYDPRAIVELRHIVREGHFDLVHAHGFKAGFIGRLGAMLGGAKAVVVTAHNHVLSRTDTPASARNRYRNVERSLAGLVSRYIAVSDSIRLELVDGYGLPSERVITVHNGVEPAPYLAPQDRAAARIEFGLPAEAPVIGLAARFSTQKGLRHLIGAVPLIRAEKPGIVVVIGGSGPLESELREHAAAVEATGSLRWPGFVENMPRFLSALDVYVSPAETEALGIALIEAALAQIPTVATRVGGVPEVVLDGETGVLVAPGDPAALASATLTLLRDREHACALAAAARERCLRDFAPALMIERTLAVYADALAAAKKERS